jgi:transposase-like protein
MAAEMSRGRRQSGGSWRQAIHLHAVPKSQWKSIRTSNAIVVRQAHHESLHEEFKRRIKIPTVLPSADTAAMLFWALLASGQITMRKVDGSRSLNERSSDQTIDLAA